MVITYHTEECAPVGPLLSREDALAHSRKHYWLLLVYMVNVLYLSVFISF